MNKKEHIDFNERIYGLAMNALVCILLYQFGEWRVLITVFACQFFFMLGAILPDFDHHKVLDKYWWAFWKNWVKHRGHWHSIGAAIIYAVIVGVIMLFVTGITIFTLIIGFVAYCGYFCHLWADTIRSLKTGSKWAIKIW